MKQFLFLALILSFTFCFAQAQNNTIVLKPSGQKGKDSQIYSLGPNNNYGSISNLLPNTWTNNNVLANIRAFIEFDLVSLPANAIIDSAFLKLYYDSSNTVNYRTHIGNNDMEVKRAESAWKEDSITWNNQPTTSNLNVVTVLPFVSNTQNYSINVSNLLKDMLVNGNYGFMVKMIDEVNFYKASIFASSDHPDSTLHPELIVNYHITTSIESSRSNLSKDLVAFPNPTTGVLNLNFLNHQPLASLQIELSNILGEVQQITPPTADSQIDLSHLAKGIYFLKLTNRSNQVYLKKVVLF